MLTSHDKCYVDIKSDVQHSICIGFGYNVVFLLLFSLLFSHHNYFKCCIFIRCYIRCQLFDV